MRFVLYNIRYGTGTGARFHMPFPFSGFFRRTNSNLNKITDFLKSLNPDIIGLVEVDSGSYRSEKNHQAELIAQELGFDHVYESKYGESSLARYIPLMRQQGNAFITNQDIHAKEFHYFNQGVKRLVIELEFESFVIFLVHLAITFRHRQNQLGDLYKMFSEAKKPAIVAGDFNAFWGDKELDLFLAATKLINANERRTPTFPSKLPMRQLDFILHDPSIEIKNFHVPEVQFSDHLPVVCDFELK